MSISVDALAAGSTISHGRATSGAVAGSGEADVVVAISPAMADTSFTVSAVAELDDAGESLRVRRVRSKTTTSVTVNVVNNSLTSQTGTVHVLAVHD